MENENLTSKDLPADERFCPICEHPFFYGNCMGCGYDESRRLEKKLRSDWRKLAIYVGLSIFCLVVWALIAYGIYLIFTVI